MVKSLRFGFLGILLLLFTPGAVLAADNINVGDSIDFLDACPGCASRGGPFFMHSDNTGETIETFCIEVNEAISLGGTNYLVHSLGAAIHGGAGASPDPDPVSYLTAAIYLMFRDGSLAAAWDDPGTGAATPGVLSNFELDVIQAFIWTQEQEITGASFGLTAAMYTAAQSASLLNAINAYVANHGGQGAVGSRVVAVNPTLGGVHKQSMLMIVPEPATLLLLGAGLLGLGVARRKFKG